MAQVRKVKVIPWEGASPEGLASWELQSTTWMAIPSHIRSVANLKLSRKPSDLEW